MRKGSVLLLLSGLWGFGSAQAANPQAAEAAAKGLCGSCHGPAGISPSNSDTIPNLAGQKETYLANVLKAYRSKEGRDHPMMHTFARNLNDAEIENFAAYFAGLPPGH